MKLGKWLKLEKRLKLGKARRDREVSMAEQNLSHSDAM